MRTWIVGLIAFLIPLALLWQTVSGSNGILLAVVAIFGLFLWFDLLLAICIMINYPVDAEYKPKKEKPKKESKVDPLLVTKIAFFPLYGLYGCMKLRYIRKQNKRRRRNYYWW